MSNTDFDSSSANTSETDISVVAPHDRSIRVDGMGADTGAEMGVYARVYDQVCPECASTRVARSRVKLHESIVRLFWPRQPYRCLICYHRFWMPEKYSKMNWVIIAGALCALALLALGVFYFQGSEKIEKTPFGSSEAPVPVVDTQPQEDGGLSERLPEDSVNDAVAPEELSASVEEQIALAKQRLENIAIRNKQKQDQIDQALETDGSEQESLLEAELSYAVEAWRSAWEVGNADEYLKFYSAKFQPTGRLTLEEWREKRRARVLPDLNLTIQLRDFKVMLNSEQEAAIVTFEQVYRSNTLRELSKKELSFAKEQGEWKIVSEREL